MSTRPTKRHRIEHGLAYSFLDIYKKIYTFDCFLSMKNINNLAHTSREFNAMVFYEKRIPQNIKITVVTNMAYISIMRHLNNELFKNTNVDLTLSIEDNYTVFRTNKSIMLIQLFIRKCINLLKIKIIRCDGINLSKLYWSDPSEITFIECDIDIKRMHFLPYCRKLKSVQFIDCVFNTSNVSNIIEKIPQSINKLIFKVSTYDSQDLIISERILDHLCSLELLYLDLSQIIMNSNIVSRLSRISSLETLYIENGEIDDRCIDNFLLLPKLKYLSIQNTNSIFTNNLLYRFGEKKIRLNITEFPIPYEIKFKYLDLLTR